ncbi:MAG: hypothetical protein FDZ70_07830, partial [Actinobacteria bacterium]
TLPKLLTTAIAAPNVPANAQRVCSACHDANGPGSAIAAYYPPSGYGTAPATNPRSGHRTKTAGNLPAGSALPCDVCHNPHGAEGGKMLLYDINVNGTTITVGDGAGEVNMTSTEQTNPVNVRNFCLTCHVTDDATGQGWNGSAMVNITSGNFLGIPRTGGVLKLPVVPTGHSAADTAWSCYVCHGDDFASSSSVNVHNPASGESRGGIPCYACHTVYQARMEDSLLTTTGPERTNWYHHVLGNGTYNGDTITYPLSAGARTDVFCLSCHVDHNLFSPFVNVTYQRGRNLRLTIGAAAPASTADATNTDFGTVANPGVCVYCHSQALTKDTANMAAGGSSKTMTVTASQYASSSHNYSAPSTFAGDSTRFNANCSKCHDGELDGGGMENGSKTDGFQTDPNHFSVHYSGEERILAAMGATVTAGMSEEWLCLRCHGNDNPNRTTLDYYGVRAMDSTSTSMTGLFRRPGVMSAHPVTSTAMQGRHRSDDTSASFAVANRHVECEDCHNVHASQPGTHTSRQSTAGPVMFGQWGVQPAWTASNWGLTTAYTTVTISGGATDYEAYLCFKCHSSYAAPSVGATGLTGIVSPSRPTTRAYAQVNVARDFNPNNFSGHNVMGDAFTRAVTSSSVTWAKPTDLGLAAPWSIDSSMTCSDCHTFSGTGARGPHGSANRYLLKWGGTGNWYDRTSFSWGTSANNFCAGCHTSERHSFPSRSDHTRRCNHCHVVIPHGWKSPRLLRGRSDRVANAYVVPDTVNGDGFYGINLVNITDGPGSTETNCGDSCDSARHPITNPTW